jgi:hypothetical protein
MAALLALVLTVAASFTVDTHLYFLISKSLTHERFLPYLVIHVFQSAGSIAGLLIGGLTHVKRVSHTRGYGDR